MKNKVHIYGPQFSNFVRNVQLVCEEKAIAYTLGFDVNDESVAFKGEQHEHWHPYKKVPILLDGQFALSETAVICRYLDENYPGVKLQPESPLERAIVEQWCQIISIYIDKAIVRDYLLEIVFPKGENGRIRYDVLEQNRPELERAISVVAEQLADKEYLLGDQYTLADIMLVPILYYVREILNDEALFHPDSKLFQYLYRLEGRCAVKTVLIPEDKPKGTSKN